MTDQPTNQPEREHQLYCPSCRIVVPWNHATHEETHDVRAGGCGAKLWWKPKDDTQEPAGQPESEKVEEIRQNAEEDYYADSPLILDLCNYYAALLKQVEILNKEKAELNQTFDHLETDLRARVESLERVREDAEIVSALIIGWWPGLEDALSWPVDEPYEDDRRYAAAKRIHDAREHPEENDDRL